MMRKTIKLTEQELNKLIRKIIKEQVNPSKLPQSGERKKTITSLNGKTYAATIEGMKTSFTIDNAWISYGVGPSTEGQALVTFGMYVTFNNDKSRSSDQQLYVSSVREKNGFVKFQVEKEGVGIDKWPFFTLPNLTTFLNAEFEKNFGKDGINLINDPTLNIKKTYYP
jgi:hypothetical protein